MAAIDDLLVKVQAATNQFMAELGSLYADAKQIVPVQASVSDAGTATPSSDTETTLSEQIAEKTAQYEKFQVDYENGVDGLDMSAPKSLLDQIRDLQIRLAVVKTGRA